MGFDWKTCSEICNGDNETLRKFAIHAKWLHDDHNSLNNMLNNMRHTLAARDAEIEVLKTALLDGEERLCKLPVLDWKAERLDEFTIRLTSPNGEAWRINWVDKSDCFNYFIWQLANAMLCDQQTKINNTR